MLSLVDATTGYERAPILRGVSLEVGVGQVVGLLGANGAGKTTLLRLLAGALPVWDGSVRLDGHDIGQLKPWERVAKGLAHVPEGRHVFRAMTVRENLDVAGLVRPTGSADRRDEVYEIFPRLRERDRQLAGSLSGGEQQMVAIARALMTAPNMLLVDEMSAGLAPKAVQVLVDALGRVRERGVGMLLVEQSPNVIADIVDGVVLLEQGEVIGRGTIDALGGIDSLADLYLGLETST